jgi:AcrR family transcriptional regulator
MSTRTPKRPRRTYDSAGRDAAARKTRERVLDAARHLYSTRPVDSVTIAAIAQRARVSPSTIYATFASRDGILRALMEDALFGPHYTAATALLEKQADPIRALGLTASVARAIYEGESQALGRLRDMAAGSASLRAVEQEFERLRYGMQEARIAGLFRTGRARPGLSRDEARRVLWMYSSREVYRMLVTDGGWTPAAYEKWLADAILRALVAEDVDGR